MTTEHEGLLDTMVFIYLLEGEKYLGDRLQKRLESHKREGDRMFTSHLSVGEVLAGIAKSEDAARSAIIREFVRGAGFDLLSFDGRCVDTFSLLRSTTESKLPIR